MKYAKNIRAFLCGFLSLVICVFAAFCVNTRAVSCLDIKNDVMMVSLFGLTKNQKSEKPDKSTKSTTSTTAKKSTDSKSDSKENSEKVKPKKADADENTYPISEQTLGGGDFSYGDFNVRNSTYYDMDVKSLLESPLPFEFKDTRETQVLIIHTHSSESYMESDDGYYTDSFYPRTTDNDKNVIAVGDMIADTLKENGIGVIHAKTVHDHPSYDGAYSRSYDTIMSYLEKYENIKVVLDIHRDSMTTEDMTKIKPTFTYKGKKGAQIMIMTGHNEDGSFPTWEENLSFALKLQNECESKYSGMTRPLYFGDFTYNMNVNSGSLLIEVGTDANTLDEALYSGKLLAKAMSRVLQNA